MFKYHNYFFPKNIINPKHIIELFNKQENIIFKERNTIKKINFENNFLVVKSFKVPNTFNQFIYRNIRNSKAKKSYFNSLKLLKLGIKTPKPVLYIEERNLFKIKKSYFISEYFEYDFTFRELLEQREEFQDFNFIMNELTTFIYNMHQNNVCFNDLSPGNILFIRKNSKYIDICIIDVNRMKFKKMNLFQRMKNFTRLSPTLEMITIISEKYAKLSSENPDILYELLYKNALKFEAQKTNKRLIKEIIKK